MHRLRTLVALVAWTTVALLGAPPAWAHVEVRESEPAAGGTVTEGHDTVTLSLLAFDPDGPVDVEVTDPAGEDVTVGEPEVDARTSTVSVRTEPLDVGEHRVHWHALSDDGDGGSEGTYAFTVEQAAGTGWGIWLVWIVAIAVPAAIFLRPGRRRAG